MVWRSGLFYGLRGGSSSEPASPERRPQHATTTHLPAIALPKGSAAWKSVLASPNQGSAAVATAASPAKRRDSAPHCRPDTGRTASSVSAHAPHRGAIPFGHKLPLSGGSAVRNPRTLTMSSTGSQRSVPSAPSRVATWTCERQQGLRGSSDESEDSDNESTEVFGPLRVFSDPELYFSQEDNAAEVPRRRLSSEDIDKELEQALDQIAAPKVQIQEDLQELAPLEIKKVRTFADRILYQAEGRASAPALSRAPLQAMLAEMECEANVAKWEVQPAEANWKSGLRDKQGKDGKGFASGSSSQSKANSHGGSTGPVDDDEPTDWSRKPEVPALSSIANSDAEPSQMKGEASNHSTNLDNVDQNANISRAGGKEEAQAKRSRTRTNSKLTAIYKGLAEQLGLTEKDCASSAHVAEDAPDGAAVS